MDSAENAEAISAKFGLPDGVSPFLNLLTDHVRDVYKHLSPEEVALIISIAYLEYCEDKKYVTQENALSVRNARVDRNVTHVYTRYLKPDIIGEFASNGFNRTQGYKKEFAKDSIAQCARSEIENIKVMIEPGLMKKVKEHASSVIATFILGILITVAGYAWKDQGADSNICKTSVWLLMHSSHYNESRSINCEAKSD